MTAISAIFEFTAMVVVIWLTPTLRAYRIFRRAHRARARRSRS